MRPPRGSRHTLTHDRIEARETRAARLIRALRRHPWAGVLTAGVLASQAARVPALTDPLGATLPSTWHLSLPLPYALLSPIFSLWDSVAMLSRSRLTGFLLGLGLGYLIWRILVRRRRQVRRRRVLVEEARILFLSLAGLGLFVAAGLAWNTRPVRRLVGLGIDDLAVEVHSHTNVSHDVRSWPVAGFDAGRSRRWHQRAGVDLLFVTDHNLTSGWQRDTTERLPGETQICPGIEVSAQAAHILVLGTPLPADPAAYRGSPANRARLFQEVAAAPGAVTIASLPEYRGQAAEFLAEGVGGFEIVNASPKGNDFTRLERDSTVALARRHRVPVVAAGDQHGYGATPMAWNVLRQPGWRSLDDDERCAMVVSRLKAGGPETFRIVERTRLRPDSFLPGVLTPLGVAWVAWATLGPAGAVSWLAWIWLLAVGVSQVGSRLRARRARAILSAVGGISPSSPGPR